MTENKQPHKLDTFGLLDYKKPLGKQQDMRTSTYLAHRPINDKMLGNKLQVKYKETKPYEEDSVLERHRTSDYQENYVWKFNDPDELRNVSLSRNIQHMKPFYDCNMKFLKRPMRPARSVTHSDFSAQPQTPVYLPTFPKMPTSTVATKIVIDRNKTGYSKYLDPSATTTTLDYCHRSPKDIMNSIAAKDNITFWNWKDIEYREKKVFRTKDIQLCDKLPSNECTKRRCEFRSKVKPVPNSGLTTEVRQNYLPPNERVLSYDKTHIRNIMSYMPNEPLAQNSEYKILGSGDSTQKYV